MNCAEARRRFCEQTLPRGGEAEPAYTEDFRQHLAACADCRLEFSEEVAYDRTLARQMQDVAIPADLQADLLLRLACVRALPAESPSSNRSSARRTSWMIVAACAVVLALCSPLVVWTFLPTSISLAEFEQLIEQSASVADGTLSASGDRPIGWAQLPGISEQTARQLESAPTRISAVTFDWRPRGSTNATGRLWVTPAAQMAEGRSLPGLASAEMRYRPRITHLVWQEGGIVYLLEMSDDVVALRQLRDALLRTRSLA